MKIITYNVNGIRAAIKKGFIEWLTQESPDIICIQEIKSQADQIESELNHIKFCGYYTYIYPAQKKGYSGVAIFTKLKPKHVEYGMNIEQYDFEGRTIRCDFDDFSVISVYIPSGSSGDERQEVKMKFLTDFKDYLIKLNKDFPNLVVSGDYNICHKPIDINHPERHNDVSGFLPEERQWVTELIEAGFEDSFRKFDDRPNMYSWWSYRALAREKNLGWRIDYNMVSKNMASRMSDAKILSDVYHSDHCPVMLEIV